MNKLDLELLLDIILSYELRYASPRSRGPIPYLSKQMSVQKSLGEKQQLYRYSDIANIGLPSSHIIVNSSRTSSHVIYNNIYNDIYNNIWIILPEF